MTKAEGWHLLNEWKFSCAKTYAFIVEGQRTGKTVDLTDYLTYFLDRGDQKAKRPESDEQTVQKRVKIKLDIVSLFSSLRVGVLPVYIVNELVCGSCSNVVTTLKDLTVAANKTQWDVTGWILFPLFDNAVLDNAVFDNAVSDNAVFDNAVMPSSLKERTNMIY